MKHLLVLFFALFVAQFSGAQQLRVIVHVTDSLTGENLYGAKIRVLTQEDQKAITDPAGIAQFLIDPAGEHQLQIEYMDVLKFVTIHVPQRHDEHFEVQLFIERMEIDID